MKYIIQIIITASREFEVYNYLKKQPEIIELHPLHGEFDLLAVFIDEDGTQLAPALDYFCTIPGIIRLVCLGPGQIIISRTLNNNTKKWKE